MRHPTLTVLLTSICVASCSPPADVHIEEVTARALVGSDGRFDWPAGYYSVAGDNTIYHVMPVSYCGVTGAQWARINPQIANQVPASARATLLDTRTNAQQCPDTAIVPAGVYQIQGQTAKLYVRNKLRCTLTDAQIADAYPNGAGITVVPSATHVALVDVIDTGACTNDFVLAQPPADGRANIVRDGTLRFSGQTLSAAAGALTDNKPSIAELLPDTANQQTWIDIDFGVQRQVEDIEIVASDEACAALPSDFSPSECGLDKVVVVASNSTSPIEAADAMRPARDKTAIPNRIIGPIDQNSSYESQVFYGFWFRADRKKPSNVIRIPVRRPARFLRVTNASWHPVHLSELRVVETPNAAAFRPAKALPSAQSGAAANLGNDNLRATTMKTTASPSASWEVDLGALKTVRSVGLWMPPTESGSGLALLTSTDGNNFSGKVDLADGIKTSGLTFVSTNLERAARYVRLQVANGANRAIQISELRVFVVEPAKPFIQSVVQSSTAAGGDHYNAVDGIVTIDGAASRTLVDEQPFWQVDLGTIAGERLEAVTIWNTLNSDSLLDAVLLLSSDPMRMDDTISSLSNRAVALPIAKGLGFAVPRVITIGIPPILRNSRYLRIASPKKQALALAEVELHFASGGVLTSPAHGTLIDGPSNITVTGFSKYSGSKGGILSIDLVTPANGAGAFPGVRVTPSNTPIWGPLSSVPQYAFSAVIDRKAVDNVGTFARHGAFAVRAKYCQDAADVSCETNLFTVDATGGFSSYWPLAGLNNLQGDPTFRDPDDQPNYLSRKSITEFEAIDYSNRQTIPLLGRSTAEFRQRYGFTAASELIVSYYNRGDLGLGREMHCMNNPDVLACYVRNFSNTSLDSQIPGGLKIEFGNRVAGKSRARDNLRSNDQFFATVTMIARKTLAVGTPNRVVFGAYSFNRNDLSEEVITKVALDNKVHNNTRTGAPEGNYNAPANCAACHGISSTISKPNIDIVDAEFLPFDLDAFEPIHEGTWTLAEQEAFRKLNLAVLSTNPPTATQEAILGWYGGPVGLNTAGTKFNGAFVPLPWRSPAGLRVYNDVIKPACRTCHLSALNRFSMRHPEDLERFWESPGDDFTSIALNDSRQNAMPHAEQTLTVNWWPTRGRSSMDAWRYLSDLSLVQRKVVNASGVECASNRRRVDGINRAPGLKGALVGGTCVEGTSQWSGGFARTLVHDARSDHRESSRSSGGSTDWDFFAFKLECAANEYVAQISGTSAGTLAQIDCYKSVQPLGADCSLRTPGASAILRCDADQYVAGVSADVATAMVHGLLCCRREP